MICFTIAALAMIGTPPLAGFISKWFLCIGALEAHRAIFIIVLLLSSLLGAIYFLPVVYVAFFGEKKETESDLEGDLVEEHNAHHDEEKFKVTWGEAPATMLIPIIVATLNVFVLGICAAFGGLPLSLVQIAQKMLFR